MLNPEIKLKKFKDILIEMPKPNKTPKTESLNVEGIVAIRDGNPYILILKTVNGKDEKIAQFSMSEARNFAQDILTMCSRTEADAMIHKFFNKQELPLHASAMIMADFRNFRMELDAQVPGKTLSTPVTDKGDAEFNFRKPQ